MKRKIKNTTTRRRPPVADSDVAFEPVETSRLRTVVEPDDVRLAFSDDETDPAELVGEAASQTPDPTEPIDPEGANSPDDALGLYLRQMGAIPLLNRQQELTLARRLEHTRNRFRHAALSNWLTLRRVIETFERVHAGKLALDPTIDVVESLGLTRENILQRMPHHLRTLQHLLEEASVDFRALQRTTSVSGRTRLRRALLRRLRKCLRLIEELSPRTELLERLTED